MLEMTLDFEFRKGVALSLPRSLALSQPPPSPELISDRTPDLMSDSQTERYSFVNLVLRLDWNVIVFFTVLISSLLDC